MISKPDSYVCKAYHESPYRELRELGVVEELLIIVLVKQSREWSEHLVKRLDTGDIRGPLERDFGLVQRNSFKRSYP